MRFNGIGAVFRRNPICEVDLPECLSVPSSRVGAWVTITKLTLKKTKAALMVCVFLGGGATLLGGCASSAPPGEYDPFEPMNREIFAFNHALDRNAALPAATFYKNALPEDVRTGVHNFMSNLTTPVTLANDLLQGEFTNAGYAVCRATVNSTIGIGGVLDPASDYGCQYHDEDFGQTLGVYGVPGGPYLVMPLLGASLPRDLVGKLVVDGYFNPLSYLKYDGKLYVNLAQNGIKLVDQRSHAVRMLREVERNSIDYYSAMRTLYVQRRNAAISNAPLAQEASTK